MKRVVLDTNCLLASLSSKSENFIAWRSLHEGKYILCVSNDILAEYEEIIALKTNKFVAENVINAIADSKFVEFIDPQFKLNGWFASAMSNFNFNGFSTDFECGDDFLINGEAFQYNGTKHYTSLSVTAGAMCKVLKPMALRLGAGYGLRTLAYETTDGKLVKNTDQSAAGLEVIAGIQFKIGEIIISADCVTTSFKYYEARIGIGLSLKR
jgi:hypothetical protein